MHEHRTADAATPSVPPPPSRRVRGLGFADVLCLELEPCQLSWLRTELDLARSAASEPYEERLLRMIRTQVPDDDAQAQVCGPGPLLSRLVVAAAAGAAAALSARFRDRPVGDARACAEIVETARAALAWAEVYADCQAIEWYSFDPGVDPVVP